MIPPNDSNDIIPLSTKTMGTILVQVCLFDLGSIYLLSCLVYLLLPVWFFQVTVVRLAFSSASSFCSWEWALCSWVKAVKTVSLKLSLKSQLSCTVTSTVGCDDVRWTTAARHKVSSCSSNISSMISCNINYTQQLHGTQETKKPCYCMHGNFVIAKSLSQKNLTLANHNLKTNYQILIIFGSNISDTAAYQTIFKSVRQPKCALTVLHGNKTRVIDVEINKKNVKTSLTL